MGNFIVYLPPTSLGSYTLLLQDECFSMNMYFNFDEFSYGLNSSISLFFSSWPLGMTKL